MENGTIDQAVYAEILKATRRRRKFFFSTVLIYVPALLVTWQISPTDRAMGTLFAVWVVFLIFATTMVALCRCPRCGNYFHMHGITLLILRTCLHCNLHIASNDIS